MKPQYLIAGAATFAVSVVSGFLYAKPVKELAQRADQQGDTSGCAFDRLAGIYDDIIGSEERYMWYGLFRKWLMRQAQGDVLEISAGTGRNLPHYQYSQITSLTLTDVSPPMLQQAQNKFFEELQLQYKHPELTVKFLLADAEKLSSEGQSPVTVSLHTHRYSSRMGSNKAVDQPGRAQQQQAQPPSSSVWRFKRQQQQQQQQEQQQDVGSISSVGEASQDDRDKPNPDHKATCSTDIIDSSSSSNTSSSSRGSWWGTKQQQSQPSPSPCGCERHTSSSNTSGNASNSSDSSSIPLAGSTFAPGTFDVVVDTFGLCSCEDPVQVLQQASHVLKPGGKLLLLEHGRSSWSWLNEYMDNRAAAHHRTYGCWFNRDIEDIVRKADLNIESLSRWHFGTSYLIVASPAAAGAATSNTQHAMAAAAG